MLGHRVLSAWAKSNRNEESLSLRRHSEDAGAVAVHLWEWLPSSTRAYLSAGRSDAEARVLARWLACTHDIGKLSPAFAVQVEPLAGRMRDAGLAMSRTIGRRTDTPHSIVSHRALVTYLHERGWSRRTAATYAVVAGGHHGVPPQVGHLAVAEDRSHYGGPEWAEARTELLEHLTALAGADRYLEQWAQNPLSPEQQALWTAFVIMADWISSSDLFPLGDRGESEETAADAWEALALPPPWCASPRATVDELITTRFGLPGEARANMLQRAVADAASSMNEPGMLVIEAPMGIGKTEAALMASEYLAARFGQGGVFVALPTMATSNAMFDRVLRWIEAQDSISTASAVLAHGKASLQDRYRGLMRRGGFNDVGRDEPQPEHACTAEVVAHHWLSGRKKGLLANFAVGTIDQLLFAGLKAKHLVLRHLGLVNKIVVVDEVHAADHFMMRFLARVLEWLGAYRVPVIIMSATLPTAQRIALVRAYESGRGWDGDDAALRGNIEYPAVTVIDGQRRVIDVPGDSEITRVELERLDDDPAALLERVRSALVEGGCIGIVRNTVARAQETARLLEQHFPGEIVLLHSRFVAQHRADLESHLVGELGRDGRRPIRRIVVGTQVIEQSLDIDFDLMFSDLAPIDLLFQRIGRLHRHRRPRPAPLRTPRLVLTGVDDWDAQPPSAIAPTLRIYGEWPLLCTSAVLDSRDHVDLPDDIAALVQSAYGDPSPALSLWAEQASVARSELDRKTVELESRADAWRIRGPREASTLVGWMNAHLGEVDDARGQARVRDTDEGIDVILTRRCGDEIHLLPQCGGGAIETNFCPSDSAARRALTGTVRLPQMLTHHGIIDRTIDTLEQRMYQGWQESRWLAGELVLELGEDSTAQLMNYDIRYDDIEGLVVTKDGDQP